MAADTAVEALPRIAAARPRAIVIVGDVLAGFTHPRSGAPAEDRRRERRAAERRSLVPLEVPLLTWPLGRTRGRQVRRPPPASRPGRGIPA